MALSTSPLLLDRVSFPAILSINLGANILFAAIYGVLDTQWAGNGLVSPMSDAARHWYDYVYFSIVTQSTIGYGDFQPLGWSRLFACIQAGIGIVGAGLLIAKITTASISRYNLLRKEACDDWVDIVRQRDGRIEVGMLHLEWRNGSLDFTGHNYSPEGVLVDSFHSHLLEDDWPRSLTFRYTSHDTGPDYAEGYLTVWMHAPKGGRPSAFSATVRDTIKPDIKPIIRGWRVEPGERDLLRKLTKPHHNREVVGYFLKKYLSHVPESASIGSASATFPPRNDDGKS
jgi:Ion channel